MSGVAEAGGLVVEGWPGLAPRLVLAGEGREDLSAYRALGGYAPGLAGEALVAAVEVAGLRGRGGAGFPTATKLRAVREGPAPRMLVANGEEGEPASIKDRWLMRRRPHLVLDGALRAAEAIGAAYAFLYISDAWSAQSLEAALDEFGPTPLPVRVVRVAPGYVAGEETAAVRAIGGGPAKPTDKPPRPFEAGVEGRPTLVANVETLANLPAIARGAPAETMLLTITGAVARPGLYEVPIGAGLGDALDRAAPHGGMRGLLMGGFFAGLLTPRARDLALTHAALRAVGSGLGCGAIIVLGEADCPVAAAGDVMAFFARENAGQCGACVKGTAAMSRAIAALGLGTIGDAELAKLEGWSVSLRGRGACGTLDGAAQLLATLLRQFPDAIARHRSAPCAACHRLLPADGRSRFAIERHPQPVSPP